MSLILDALNRARQNENPVPGLATHHPLEQLTAQRRQYLLWAALAVAALVIAWLVFDRFRTPPAQEADIGAPVAELSRNIGSAVNSVTTELKARAAAAEQAQQPVAPVPEPVAAAPGPAVDIAQPVVESVAVPATAPVASTAATPAAQDPKPIAVQPTAVRDEAVAQLYQNRDVDDAPAKREPSTAAKQRRAADDLPDVQHDADIDRILKEARDEMENASLDEHPAPFLADLSQRTKDGIPTLFYQRHDYSSDGAQSSVTLNGNAVKAGGSVAPGLKVEEILPDSVVLNYQGTQFRLRALNSWVNL